ncbi:hypothetical protein [uncultured Methanobrevibacter sp.]|uniref:hypothetical protein n=1 Tax=uncultured Methanobrevibacter sp. TaxID=253161 RepID=UPI0025EBE0A5|nr:hypothetical protein [uncultured Methanobrevibacter sp.]
MSTKELSYNGCKNVLCRVAYKLIKSGKTFKHSGSIIVNGKKKSYKDIIALIKKNGTNYGHDEYISRFIEDVVAKTDKAQLPGYVMGSSGVNKYSRASYRNIAKTLTSYRKQHGKNPSKITVSYEKIPKTCKNPYTSKPHYTNNGCNKLGQCTPYYCGPHSIHQGFKKFGVTNISEATIAGYVGTTTAGSDHEGLNTGILKVAKKAGIKVEIKWYNFSDLGKTNAERFKKAAEMICKPNVFAFWHIWYKCAGECTDGEGCGHYEMLDIINTSEKKVRALNSLGGRVGNGYYGHLQWRSYGLQAAFIGGISQKSLCVVTKV